MVYKTLRNGLALRSLSEGFASDRANLPRFYFDVFTEAYGPDDATMGAIGRDMIASHHPRVRGDDVWVVVDTSQNDRIVSALILIPQVWRYAGIDLNVGGIELVATDKDYRHRGLVRALMQTAHERSAALGHEIQFINGIEFYYRQFGYGMAVSLGQRAYAPLSAIRPRDTSNESAYVLRMATPADIVDMKTFAEHYGEQCLMYTVRLQAEWQHELTGKQPDNGLHITFLMIDNSAKQTVGFLGYMKRPHGEFKIVVFAVGAETSYLAVLPDVLQGLKKHLEERFAEDDEVTPRLLSFESGLHPTIFRMLAQNPYNHVRSETYAWYIRVADRATFFEKIAPVLETRLEGSGAHGYTGEVTINFYDKTGLVLVFEDGKLTATESISDFTGPADAAFPFNSFLDLVFGFRTLDEITTFYPDAYVRGPVSVVLDILFPKQHSWLLTIT